MFFKLSLLNKNTSRGDLLYMKFIKNLIFPTFSLILFLTLVFRASTAADAAREGLNLSFMTAIPALFPFFVAGSLLVKSGFASILGKLLARPIWLLYGLSGNAVSPIILGLCGGYPVGAQVVCDLYKENLIDKKQAQSVLSFCNNSGPAFIIGVAGIAIFNSFRIGVVLYVIHAISALMCGLVMCPKSSSRKPFYNIKPRENKKLDLISCFLSAVKDSFSTCIIITAFITFFSVLLAILCETGFIHMISQPLLPVFSFFGMSQNILEAFLCGLLELTNGLAILSKIAMPLNISLPLTCFLLGFGGFSVHCQTISLVSNVQLNYRKYLIGKVLHGALSSCLAIFWCII